MSKNRNHIGKSLCQKHYNIPIFIDNEFLARKIYARVQARTLAFCQPVVIVNKGSRLKYRMPTPPEYARLVLMIMDEYDSIFAVPRSKVI